MFIKSIVFRFLDSSGPALLTLLEEESAKLRGHSDLEGQEQKDVEFSDRVTVLNTEWVEKEKQQHLCRNRHHNMPQRFFLAEFF